MAKLAATESRLGLPESEEETKSWLFAELCRLSWRWSTPFEITFLEFV